MPPDRRNSNEDAAPAVDTLTFPAGDGVPNNDRFPAVLARDVLARESGDSAVRARFESNGWGGTWTWRVFDFHHFHPDAFEVLGVATGSARLHLGGPQGVDIEVTAGDVIVLPPGFGHKQESASNDFRICGAYPPGQEDYSVIRATDGYDQAVLEAITSVPLPRTDPVFGGDGPLLAALLGSSRPGS